MAVVILKHGLERHSQGTLLITDLHSGEKLFEGYVRQCVHCQNTWTYRPGSGIRRAMCDRCNGHTCGRPSCDTCYHKERRIEDLEALGRMNRAAIEALVRHIELQERIDDAVKDRVQKIMRARDRTEAQGNKEGRLVTSRD